MFELTYVNYTLLMITTYKIAPTDYTPYITNLLPLHMPVKYLQDNNDTTLLLMFYDINSCKSPHVRT